MSTTIEHKPRDREHVIADEATLLALRAKGMNNVAIAEEVGMSRQRVVQLIGRQPKNLRANAYDPERQTFNVAGVVTMNITGTVKAPDQGTAERLVEESVKAAAAAVWETGLQPTTKTTMIVAAEGA